MSGFCCSDCGDKTDDGVPGTMCGERIDGKWCRGVLGAHQEGICQWCPDAPPKQEPQRDALWCAIYAAEFVRLRAAYDSEDLHRIDERMLEADKWARHLADEHVRVVLKAER